ncbi:MAG: hypothetical protein QM766_02000 [Burkholderiaceae bacterium]
MLQSHASRGGRLRRPAGRLHRRGFRAGRSQAIPRLAGYCALGMRAIAFVVVPGFTVAAVVVFRRFRDATRRRFPCPPDRIRFRTTRGGRRPFPSVPRPVFRSSSARLVPIFSRLIP